jgi:uncharacterized protein
MFVIAPGLLSLVLPGSLLFPAIWLLAAICLAALLLDRSFDRRAMWNLRGVAPVASRVLTRFAIFAAVLAVALVLYEPQRVLALPRERPSLWAIIMLGYPVLSVYPQELAFRAFFIHRYAALFRTRAALIAANALAFGWAHILMHNWIAIAFSVVGGVFFADTYLRSRSTLAACIEHALYGCWLFTIGWGWYFYAGATR